MKRILFFAFLFATMISGAFAQKPGATPAPAPFLFEVEDVFSISGVGTVVTGKIESGKVKVGDTVEIVGIKPTKATTVTKIESFRKLLSEAEAPANVGLFLRGVEKTDVVRGQVIAATGTVTGVAKFKATIELLESHNGGRSTPIATGYRPQLFFRTVGFSGVVTLPAGTTAAPGTKGLAVDIELTEAAPIAKGSKFAIRDGGRTIGGGTITSVSVK